MEETEPLINRNSIESFKQKFGIGVKDVELIDERSLFNKLMPPVKEYAINCPQIINGDRNNNLKRNIVIVPKRAFFLSNIYIILTFGESIYQSEFNVYNALDKFQISDGGIALDTMSFTESYYDDHVFGKKCPADVTQKWLADNKVMIKIPLDIRHFSLQNLRNQMRIEFLQKTYYHIINTTFSFDFFN